MRCVRVNPAFASRFGSRASLLTAWTPMGDVTFEQAAIDFARMFALEMEMFGDSVQVDVEGDGVSHTFTVSWRMVYEVSGLRGGM